MTHISACHNRFAIYSYNAKSILGHKNWRTEVHKNISQKLSKILVFSLFLFAITSVPARAELDFGFGAEYQGNYERALIELQPLAEAGDPRAQLWLGLMYYYGRGVKFNLPTALMRLRKSANQHYHNGEFALCFIVQGCFSGGSPNTN